MATVHIVVTIALGVIDPRIDYVCGAIQRLEQIHIALHWRRALSLFSTVVSGELYRATIQDTARFGMHGSVELHYTAQIIHFHLYLHIIRQE